MPVIWDDIILMWCHCNDTYFLCVYIFVWHESVQLVRCLSVSYSTYFCHLCLLPELQGMYISNAVPVPSPLLAHHGYHMTGYIYDSKRLTAKHYNDITMGVIASQIASSSMFFNYLLLPTSTKHQTFALLALCEGNSLATSEFCAQMASNMEKASIWWRLVKSPHRCSGIRIAHSVSNIWFIVVHELNEGQVKPQTIIKSC